MSDETPTVELWKRVQDERDALRGLIWDWYAAETALSKLHPSKRTDSFEFSWVQKATANLRDVAVRDGRVPPAVAQPKAPDDTGAAIVALLHAAQVDNPGGWRLHIGRDEGTIVVAVHTAQGLINGTGSTLRDAVCSASKQVAARAAQCSAWGAAVSQHVGAANTPDPASHE